MSRVECLNLSNGSTKISVAIFRVKMLVGIFFFWKPYVGQAIGVEWGTADPIDGARAPIQHTHSAGDSCSVSKPWVTFNIRRGLSPKAEVLQR
jgi:hypothetical protein